MIEIQGSADFLGFNHYTSSLAYPTPPNQIDPAKMSWDSDSDVLTFKDPKWCIYIFLLICSILNYTIYFFGIGMPLLHLG